MEVSGKTPLNQDRAYCEPCSREGENIDADAFCAVCEEFLCSTCINEHRALKPTKRHTLLDRKSMPKSMTDKFNEEDNNVPCDIHPKEFIKYFCPAHETVNCGHCLAFEHRSCKISLVSDISDSFKTSQDYGDIKNIIAKLLAGVNDCISDIEIDIKTVLKIGKDEVKRLKDYREKVNTYFDEREKSLLEIIEQIKEMDRTSLDSLKSKCDNIRAKLEEMKCKLDAQNKNSTNLFIEAKQVRKQVKCLKAALNDISKETTIQRYEFKKDMATEKLLAGSVGFGTVIKDQTSGNQMIPIIDLTRLTFTPREVIPLKSPSDNGNCQLTNMLLLPEHRLLVTDFNNRTLKLVDLHTSSMISQINVKGQPWGLCLLPRNRVAVGLYDERSIIFLETRGQITVRTSIKVNSYCFDVAYHNNTLFVSLEGGKVEKVDMIGNTLDSVNEKSLFSCCWNLTIIDDGRRAAIFVSDYGMQTITKLDMNLNILQTFKDPAIQKPRGIIAVGNQLLISSYGSHKLLRLDLSSGNIIELLGESDGIYGPCSVVYSRWQNKLYITSNRSGKIKFDNNVHVYKALLI